MYSVIIRLHDFKPRGKKTMSIYSQRIQTILAVIFDGGNAVEIANELDVECEVVVNSGYLMVKPKASKELLAKSGQVVIRRESGAIGIISQEILNKEFFRGVYLDDEQTNFTEEAQEIRVIAEPLKQPEMSELPAIIIALGEISKDKNIHLFGVDIMSEWKPVYICPLQMTNITATFNKIEKGVYLIGVFDEHDIPTTDYPFSSYLTEKK